MRFTHVPNYKGDSGRHSTRLQRKFSLFKVAHGIIIVITIIIIMTKPYSFSLGKTTFYHENVSGLDHLQSSTT